MPRKRKDTKKSIVFPAVVGGAVACILAGTVGYFAATASASDATAGTTGLGFGTTTFQSSISIRTFDSEKTNQSASSETNTSSSTTTSTTVSDINAISDSINERNQLQRPATCDMSAGLQAISDRVEAARRAAEEAARIAEQNHIAEVQTKVSGYSYPSGLSAVDWSVGKSAFLSEWTQRIDAYLAGSNLAGYGATFAEAAWEYGVDPRWSPAISNTESSKGSVCFLPYNAWGWGSYSWSSWGDAIWAHVAGLAKGYGYGISYSAASTYCPPNTLNWYNNTVSEMAKI